MTVEERARMRARTDTRRAFLLLCVVLAFLAGAGVTGALTPVPPACGPHVSGPCLSDGP